MTTVAMARALCMVSATMFAWQACPADAADTGGPAHIVVDGTTLGEQDFDEALAIVTQRRYYHGNVPESAVESLRQEARQALIDRTLLLNEARRRGLHVAPDAAEAALQTLEQRHHDSSQWAARRAHVRERILDDALIDQLYAQERAAAGPVTDAQAESYFNAHRDQFIEPEQQRVRVILLGVEASAPKATWDAARIEALEVAQRLRGGADFAAEARLRSSDASAALGGDMGYLHRGMLPEPAQDAVDAIGSGGISDPVTLLSGVAVFRLDDRRTATAQQYAAVQERARDLALREAQERRSAALIESLRGRAVIRVAAVGSPSTP